MKSVRTSIFLVLLLLAAMAIVPRVSADEKNITINITSPEEGDTFYLDVAPAFITVQGTIDAPHGIRNVSITNGEDFVVCGSNYGIHYSILCNVPCYSHTNHITVTTADMSGNSASATRNFTRFTGPPPPGTIWVTGWVVDSKGQPIFNASIIFEGLGDNKPVVETIKTDLNGMYKTKKAFGFNQRITAHKEGYQTFVREMRFKQYGNEFNITLTPEGTSVTGFHFGSAILAILVSLFLVIIWRSR
jgi:hypothetical protein